MAEVGVRTFLDDGVSSALRNVGRGAESTLNSVRSAADKAKGAFEVLGDVTSSINQGLEIAKKGWELFRTAVVDTISTALEFRDKNDPVIKQFEEMRRNAELLRAALGDALIPVVQAVAAAFGPVNEGVTEWIRNNRRLIASNILNFLGSVANILTRGVAQALIIVSRAWTGWELIIEGTKAAVNSFFSILLDGVDLALGALRSLAQATGADGLAAQLEGAQDAVRGLGEVFGESADTAIDEMMRIQAEQEELEKQARRVSNVITTTIAEAVVNGQAIIADSIAGTTRTVEEQETAADEAAARAAARAEAEKKRLEELTKAREKAAADAIAAAEKAAEEELRLAQERQAAQEATTAAIATSAVNASGAIVEALLDQEATQEDVSKSVLKTVLNTVREVINALAAQAAAGALSQSVTALGPVGIAVGTAAAGVAFSLVNSFIDRFQDGGFVRGGVPNRDSVPILAQQGEFVMSRNDVAGFRKFASRVLGASSGQQLADAAAATGSARTQAGDLTENTTIINRMWFPQRAEEMRMSRRQASSVAQLRRLGMVIE